MEQVLIFILVLVSIALIVLVLLQHGKGADVGANLANMTDAEKILLDQLTSAGLDDTKAKKFVEQIMKYKSSGS